VILIDYGNEIAVKYGAIRRLPPYFCSIPGFAYRVHLDAKHLVPTGGMPSRPHWSTEAVDSFRKYLSLWQDTKPVYYLWRHPGAVIVQLDTYGQDLSFNPLLATWEKRVSAGPCMESDLTQQLDTTRPMIRNLCRSIGVNLAYERLTGDTEPYLFARAWEILLKRGVAYLPKEEPKTKKKTTN